MDGRNYRSADGVESQFPLPPSALNLSSSRLLNSSDGNDSENMTLLFRKLQPYLSNRAMDDTPLIALIVAYVVLIFTGACGNGLVCIAVARKPQMRTARNVFIINLAISDLILCLFTMPFSLVEILMKFWPLGVITCKLVAGLQATSIFVSTISITAIALDRYKVIVYPTQESCRPLRAFLTLSCIWIISLLLSTPLFVFRNVDHYYVGLASLNSVDYCIEKWPLGHGRGFYSLFSMLFQYLLPICIVSIAYARICRKLKYRMVTNSTTLQEKQERDKKRMRKTNVLLISIALIFGLSWLPLNILNVVADFCYPFNDDTTFRIVFACCHMAGMSSACSNPLLYGWLNENFRKEFKDIFSSCSRSLSGGKSGGNEGTESFVLGTRNQTHPVVPQQVQVETTIDGTAHAVVSTVSPVAPMTSAVLAAPVAATDASPTVTNAATTDITSVLPEIYDDSTIDSVVHSVPACLTSASISPTSASISPTSSISADATPANNDAPIPVNDAAAPTSMNTADASPTVDDTPPASISSYSSITADANHSIVVNASPTVVTLSTATAIVKVV